MERVHLRTCPLCDAMCGLAISTEGDRVTRIEGDADDVFSRGHLCPKAHALRDLHEDPDRLRQPMRRGGDRWSPIPWEAALDEAADRIGEVIARHGPDAVALYEGNPTVHDYGATLGVPLMLGALGTRNHFNANSQDSNPKLYACLKMYGSTISLTVPDVDRTDYLLMLGANPAVSNGSTMSLGDVKGRLRGVRERGGRMVLIDPRRSETAAMCDEHHFIRPGGDAALLLAMLHVLFAEGLVDAGAVEARAGGLATLRELAGAFPPSRIGDAVGVAPEVIGRLAREFAAAPTAVAYARVGVCQNEFGLVASWLVEALNVVTGNFDRPGGAMFPAPAAEIGGLERRLMGRGVGRWRSRVRGLPECAGALPSAVMAEEMLTPGKGQVRAFVTLAGNPVLSVPDGPRLADALAQLDVMVSVDAYLNETTRHAHLVLPPVSHLERPHFDLLLQALAVRNVVRYSEPVFAPPPDGRTDHEILASLAARITARRVAPRSFARGLARAIEGALPSPERVVDLLVRFGPYGSGLRPWRDGMTLDAIRAHPHGKDLGALTSQGAARVRTKDGRVDLAPEALVRDVDRVGRWVDAGGGESLVLIGRRHLRSNNSWMHNCPSLVKGPDRATLLVHPDDAARLGIADGSSVRVRSATGELSARAALSRDMKPGVVSLPHGYGHQGAAGTLRVAGALPGANVNALTSDAGVEPVIGNSVLNGVPVEVTATSQ